MRVFTSAGVTAALVATIATSPVHASPSGTSEMELTWSGGVLGRFLTYQLAGDPADLAVLIPSVTPGPTPLNWFFPGDPRELEVGLELVFLAWIGFLDAAGEAQVAYGIPDDPTLSGIVFYAQSYTINDSITAVEELSNPTRFVLSDEGEAHYTLVEGLTARRDHSMTVLDDGRVLIAGGEDLSNPGRMLDSFEIFDPRTQEFTDGSDIGGRRSRHTATLLNDGRVLLAGGVTDFGIVLDDGVLVDPCTLDTVTVPGALQAPRVHHTATKLENGDVLVVGGSQGFGIGDSLGWPTAYVGPLAQVTDLFDSTTSSWTVAGPLPFARTLHGASRLGDGRVLVTGGIGDPTASGVNETLDDCLFYLPHDDKFVAAPSLPEPRAMHGQTAAIGGGAMIAGGGLVDLVLPNITGTANSRRYDGGIWELPIPNFDWLQRPRPVCVGDLEVSLPVTGGGGGASLRGGYQGDPPFEDPPVGQVEYVIIPCPEHWDAGSSGLPVPYQAIFGLRAGATAWEELGDLQQIRNRVGGVALDGHRLLLVGTAGAIPVPPPGTGFEFDRTAEVFTYR